MIPALCTGIEFTCIVVLIASADIKGMSNKSIKRLTAAVLLSTICAIASFSVALFSL